MIDREIEAFKREAVQVDGVLDLDVESVRARREAKFLLMKVLAGVYLPPPASTAEIERFFSVCGRVDRPHRTRLLTKSLVLLTKLKHRTIMKARMKAPESESCV